MMQTKKLAYLAPVAVALALGGCETLTVPDFNNPGIDELTKNPTRGAVLNAAQGVMIGAREGIGEFNRYVSTLGVLGRESYNFDGSDPRFITELLAGPTLDPGGASFGGSGHWADRYANIRNANILLDAVDAAAAGVLTTEEGEAIRGFAKTLQAHDFLLVVNTRDDFGAPIAVGGDPTGAPAPIVSRTEVFNHIVTLLNEAQTHLQAGGSSFPFQMSSGFAGFNTPAAFLQFNRGLKARVNVYMASLGIGTYTDALTSLGASFINPATPDASAALAVSDLEVGVFHAYGTGPGDITNGLFSKKDVLVAHPSIAADIQAGDERLDRKTGLLATPASDPGGTFGISSDRDFTVYGSLSAGIAFIRNEELILLRAEANMQLGNLSAALEDINLIRRVSGGLSPVTLAAWTAMTSAQRVDELLYNRRYSLLLEGGHRWIDARRYNRLTDLPVDITLQGPFVRYKQFPFPEDECVARDPRPSPGCDPVVGF